MERGGFEIEHRLLAWQWIIDHCNHFSLLLVPAEQPKYHSGNQNEKDSLTFNGQSQNQCRISEPGNPVLNWHDRDVPVDSACLPLWQSLHLRAIRMLSGRKKDKNG